MPTKNAKPHTDLGHKISYSEKYDAYWCENCNEWLERACTDPECRYCPGRPEKPNA